VSLFNSNDLYISTYYLISLFKELFATSWRTDW